MANVLQITRVRCNECIETYLQTYAWYNAQQKYAAKVVAFSVENVCGEPQSVCGASRLTKHNTHLAKRDMV